MRIGIIGSDDRAVAIGRLLRSGGHELSFGDPVERGRAQRAAATVGARETIPYEQAMRSDVLFFTVPRQSIDPVVKAVGSGAEAIVVDAVEGERGDGTHSGAEILSQKLDCHGLVRALIAMPQSGASIDICGDDRASKSVVDRALRACGCATIDRGPLSYASELEAPA